MKAFLTTALVAAVALPVAADQAAEAVHADMVSVRSYGAVGDGKTDDTAAFLRAVAVGKAEGMHVYVPRGRYRISKTIELENIGVSGPAVGAWPADVEALPSIIPSHRGGPAFRLLAGASLRGLDITYHWDGEPDDGPPAVLISGIGAYISDMRIRYAWDGIMTDGQNNVGRLNIENVFMVSIRNVGLRVTGTWDVPRLSNIEVWNAGPVKRGLEKGVGFLLGKNDLIRLSDCFVFAMSCGFLLDDKMEGCKIEGGTWGVMNGCSTDFCARGIVVRGRHTLSVAGGTFWQHQESLVVDGRDAMVRVCGSELKSNGAPAVLITECDHAVITGCSLLRPMKSFDAPAAVLQGGRVTLVGNYIESQGPGVMVDGRVRRAVISANLIDAHGHQRIVDRSGPNARVYIGGANAGGDE